MYAPILLQLDIAGNPAGFINHRQAITMMASDRIIAGLGEHEFIFRGGYNRITARRSEMVISSILLTKERVVSNRLRNDYEPPLTNKALFARDGFCMYCGAQLSKSSLTRDHVIPRSRGGTDTWSNCVTACRKCNQDKGNKTPEEWGRLLLAVPYAPNWAEHLYLRYKKRIIADQMEFLKARFSKDSPLLQ